MRGIDSIAGQNACGKNIAFRGENPERPRFLPSIAKIVPFFGNPSIFIRQYAKNCFTRRAKCLCLRGFSRECGRKTVSGSAGFALHYRSEFAPSADQTAPETNAFSVISRDTAVDTLNTSNDFMTTQEQTAEVPPSNAGFSADSRTDGASPQDSLPADGGVSADSRTDGASPKDSLPADGGVSTDSQSCEQTSADKSAQNHCAEIADPETGAIYRIIGTAHVSEASRAEVEQWIEKIRPDKVCIELCQERYDSFYDVNRWKKLNIFDVIRKGKFLYLLANIAISAFQRKIGAKLGVKPGAELIGAAEAGKRAGADIVLIDRNIHITLKRVWGNLGFWTKCELLSEIIFSLFGADDKSKEETSNEIESLKEDANISSMMEVFAKELPQVHAPLIDERDRYLVAKMRACGGKNVVAVVGAGHVAGMQKYFNEKIDTESLEQLPKPGIFLKAAKWVIPLILIGGIAIGICRQGFDTLYDLLVAWVLPNSVFCFLTAILALAHPLTALCAIVVSPITSTTPVIGAGIVLGLLEAWLRKPTVEDCEDLPNVHTLKGFYKNSFTHVLIVCVLTTFGSALGAWIGIGWLIKIIGFGD